MDELRGKFSLDTMSKILKTTPNSYYNWKKRGKVTNTKTKNLKDHIRTLFYENKAIYGAPRIHQLLIREGIKMSESYVSRLMKSMGLIPFYF